MTGKAVSRGHHLSRSVVTMMIMVMVVVITTMMVVIMRTVMVATKITFVWVATGLTEGAALTIVILNGAWGNGRCCC